MRWWPIFLSMGVCAISAVSQQEPVYTGTIVDPDGNNVAGVDVAQFWLGGQPDNGGFRAYGATKSDAEGKFALKLNDVQFPETLFAMDSGRRRGAVFVVPAEGLATNLRIQLQPLHRVSYRFQNPGSTDLRQTRISLRPTSGSTFSQITGAAESSILLPPGTYTFEILAPGGKSMDVNFEISARVLA